MKSWVRACGLSAFLVLSPAQARIPVVTNLCELLFAKRVLVIDGFSTGALLAPYFSSKGLVVDHMHTASPDAHYAGGFKAANYRKNFMASDYAAALEFARANRYDAIVPGSEIGVIFAAQLNSDLGLAPARSDELNL